MGKLVRVAREIAQAVSYLHERAIVPSAKSLRHMWPDLYQLDLQFTDVEICTRHSTMVIYEPRKRANNRQDRLHLGLLFVVVHKQP